MEQEIKDMTEKVKESIETELVEKILSDNKFEFDENGVSYRIRKPSFKEKQEVYKKKIQKFTELMKDKTLLLEADWIKQYKERGIDIEEMNKNIIRLEGKKQGLQYTLGKEIEKKSKEDDLKKLRDEIASIEQDQMAISVQKTSYLQFSIEYQLNVFLYAYMITLVTEKKVEDKWVRVWNSYEEFENSDEALINKVSYYASIIVKDEIDI